LEKLRILMGDEVSKRTKKAFEAGLAHITCRLDKSIEEAKEEDDFLSGVPAIVGAITWLAIFPAQLSPLDPRATWR